MFILLKKIHQRKYIKKIVLKEQHRKKYQKNAAKTFVNAPIILSITVK